MAPRWGQDGEQIEKNEDPTKNRHGSVCVPDVEAKKWPTWPQVELRNRAKIDKKSIQNQSKN